MRWEGREKKQWKIGVGNERKGFMRGVKKYSKGYELWRESMGGGICPLAGK